MIKSIAFFLLFFNFNVAMAEIRIICLDPAAEKWVKAIAYEQYIVGVSSFTNTDSYAKKPSKIGDSRNFDWESVLRLKPTHILSVGLDNHEIRDRLKRWQKPYLDLPADQLHHLNSNWQLLANFFQLDSKKFTEKITENNKRWAQLSEIKINKSYISILDMDPIYIAGAKTYIGQSLNRCGLQNSFKAKYQKTSMEELIRKQPDFFLIQNDIVKQYSKESIKKRFAKYFSKDFKPKFYFLPADFLSQFHPGIATQNLEVCAAITKL